MKHAFLIMAHGHFELLSKLLDTLDGDFCDIFVHFDKKVNVPEWILEKKLSKSSLSFIQEVAVYWGGFSQIKAELALFNLAKQGNYDYYHLISGQDFPIVSQKKFYNFFEENKGNEFIRFDYEYGKSPEVKRRYQLYHFFEKINLDRVKVFSLFRKCLLSIQKICAIRRNRDLDVYYGSNWCSVTHNFVIDLCENEDWIYKHFVYTKCGDELFIHTFAKKMNYNIINDNLRFINFINGNSSPEIIEMKDFEKLQKSKCLFARKFSIEKDSEVIDLIIKKIGG